MKRTEDLFAYDLKTAFLSGLKGKSSAYKRYMGSPLRYGGGKSLAVGFIIERIPLDIPRLISPFIGGGSVEFAVANELNIPVLAFDIFGMLINFYTVLKYNKYELIRILSSLDTSRETFERIRTVLCNNDKQELLIDDNITRAAYYFYNHNLSYGPSYLGWASTNYLNHEKKYTAMIDRLNRLNVHSLDFACKNFEEVIPTYPDDFFYLDPPYFLGGTSTMFAGIYPMRNAPYHHKNFNHTVLAELLKQHTGGFVLSYNDCAEIRALYKNFEIIDVHWQYTMGQGELRIGKNRLKSNQQHVKQSHELLIVGEKLD
ncbi:putative DNA adenine methylase [Pillotina sp. SPG140]|jgi:DNA adenine methylase